MAHIKEELQGVVTLGMAGKVADGVLAKDIAVKLTGDLEVGKITAAQDKVFGYLTVGNKVAGDKVTVCTRGKKVSSETSGAAFSLGSFLTIDQNGKFVKATGARASGTITVVDNTWDGGETITVNGVTLTVVTDFANGASAAASAINIANAINAKVSGVFAKAASNVVTVSALDAGDAGNAITLATSDTSEFTVSGATLSGGVDNWPVAIALEAATAADQTKTVLWLV